MDKPVLSIVWQSRALTTLKDWIFTCAQLYLLSTENVILAVAAGKLEKGVVISLGRSGKWNLELC